MDSEYSENIPVARDHEHLVRFSGPDDDAYVTLCQTLTRKIAEFLARTSQIVQSGRCFSSFASTTRQRKLRGTGHLYFTYLSLLR
jgi:hypothetical protein